MAISLTVANNSASQKGRYSYKSVLGVGSFGTVFCANDGQDNNEQVAVKIVKVRESVLDVILRRRKSMVKLGEAKQEVDLLVKLTHENIVAIKDFFEFTVGMMGGEMGIAMIMEYCEKGNLQDYLSTLAASNQRLDLSQRKLWYKQLATALQFIHSKGIIHRDLKPANILLDSNKNLKVADVGLARTAYEVKSHCKDLSSDTTFNQYMSSLTGTPTYMAPEIWNEHYSIASDVFSLGLICVMIAVVPNPPIPYAHWEQKDDCLGKLQNESPTCHSVLPTNLLNLPLDHLPETESNLLNKMLEYDYHKRIDIGDVVNTIDTIQPPQQNDTTTATTTTSTADSTNEGSWCIIL